MKIKEIELYSFRNYNYLKLKPNENINVFVGKNGIGKTNILEAISILISGKSFRTNRDRQIVSFGANKYQIDALISFRGMDKDYTISYEMDKKKKMRINLSSISSIKELRRESPIVVFVPEELEIVKGGPALRRNFMDNLIGSVNLIYRYNLEKYKKILAQKNELLKRRNIKLNENLLFEAYNIQLASIGSYIIAERKEFLNVINKKLKVVHGHITDDKEELKIEYKNPLRDLVGIKEIEAALIKALRDVLPNDLMMKTSTFGPHRDDFPISFNNLDLKTFGSQGQQRSAVLSMKLTELQIVKEVSSIKPILLLDDVFSELDIKRRERLIESLKDIQSFITMAEYKYIDEFKEINKNIYQVNEEGVTLIDGGKNDR